jgi:poly-gamma-glutamate synthesis protein (capsule biosynthesis protein)
VITTLATTLTMTACPAPARPVATPTTASATTPAPAPTPSPAVAQAITLAFGGDVHFTGRTVALLTASNPVGSFAAPLSAADLAMVNLETAITTRGTPEPKEFHFRAPATAYEALRRSGVDVASLGNNHALDYGRVGLADTLNSARAAGFPVVGAGRDIDEAYGPYLTTIRGLRVAILAMSQIHTLAEEWKPTATRSGIAMTHDRERAVAAVRAARTQADVVIVYLHWGVERSNCPKDEMRSFAAAMAGAGATMVVGTHAHVPLAGGFIGTTYVHYGLGNFVWYVGSSDSVLLSVTVTAVPGGGPDHALVTAEEVTPAVISSTGQARPVSGAQAAGVLDRLADAQRCARLAAEPVTG